MHACRGALMSIRRTSPMNSPYDMYAYMDLVSLYVAMQSMSKPLNHYLTTKACIAAVCVCRFNRGILFVVSTIWRRLHWELTCVGFVVPRPTIMGMIWFQTRTSQGSQPWTLGPIDAERKEEEKKISPAQPAIIVAAAIHAVRAQRSGRD